MATREDVEKFLSEFRTKVEIFHIIYRDDRNKNLETMAELAITGAERTAVVKSIVLEDYSIGPIADVLNHYSEMWVFGKDVKGREVYIKISLGHPGSSAICISFHLSDFPMSYPFK
jgi:hypothetical protein